MNKKNQSESDTSDKLIRPATVLAGWHTLDQIYAQYPLRTGRVVVRGKTARRDPSSVLFADFVLCLKPNIPLAVVEAKRSSLSLQAGMQQAIHYAQRLDLPFCFASNGEGFVFRDATLASGVLEQTLALDQFPLPQDLWARYCKWKGWSSAVQSVAGFDYALATTAKTPRYYQLNAINRTVEAIAAGQNRVLLVMATGTGKTYTAFQIIHRLWKSPWRTDKPCGQKRILFLADRNILIDQTMVNDFRPFKGAMAKLSPHAKGIERINEQGQVELEEVDLAVHKSTKLARNPQLLCQRHPGRPDRHTQRNQGHIQQRLLWRSHLHLQPQAGH